MPQKFLRLLAGCLLVLVAVAAQAAQQSQPTEIAYTVAMSRPHTHLLEVEMRVGTGGAQARTLDVTMPVWTPGSYLVREYARHVQDFAARSTAGQQLAWSKIDKDTWRVEVPANTPEVLATYRVYANELTVRTNELNDRHAFWNNAALLMFVDGQLSAPSTLRVVPFSNWKVATGLPAVAGETNTFRAENFDVLYDAPVEVGNFQAINFAVRGVPHRIIVEGEGNYEAERLRGDVGKIVEASVALMGGEIPYRDYTFIINLRADGAGGGLEHLNSTALIASPFAFQNAKTYRGFLALVAHEFFHLWNVKRIRPDVLGPFDYTRENYTKSLWVAEGITSYYEEVILRRAGLVTGANALESLAETIQKIERTPGRRVISLEESSFDAWIKYYRPDANSVNSQVSYYDKGALVGMLLDLEIRRVSNGARSLDDVMRSLFTDFFKKNRNYTPADFERAAETAAGGSLDKFFDAYVRGRADLDYNTAFAAFGLRLDVGGGGSNNAQPAPAKAFLSNDLRQDGDRLVVVRVVEGTPAYEYGLSAADQIVALDDFRVTKDTLLARLADRRPGDTVRLTVFRFDELRTFEVKLGAEPPGYKISRLPQPTADQQRLYQGWLGT